ncbi:MAG: hypothetical protein HDS69_04430 [Bacteroidales bacterium]|nr:hypothetical protein [Bacteroidales bacterium]MBD5229267.1 hypothetical protein [Bacteroidales bacterium]MBD5247688.1 hypothetical protein [Barnesiella sp.]
MRANIRRFPLALLAVMLVSLLTTSCDDDDDFIYSPLIGHWSIVSPPYADYNEYHFMSDGTGYYYIDDYAGQSTYYFTYETYDDVLNVYFNMGDTWSFNWGLSNGYMYLYPFGSGETLVYERF